MIHLLNDLFPGVARENMMLLNDISANGGKACIGDVVSCLIEDKVHLGELTLCVGIQGSNAYALISLWKQSTTSTDEDWREFAVSDDDVVLVPLESIDTIFTHRMSPSRKTCVVFSHLKCDQSELRAGKTKSSLRASQLVWGLMHCQSSSTNGSLVIYIYI